MTHDFKSISKQYITVYDYDDDKEYETRNDGMVQCQNCGIIRNRYLLFMVEKGWWEDIGCEKRLAVGEIDGPPFDEF
jgi:hypothetical protein